MWAIFLQESMKIVIVPICKNMIGDICTTRN